MCSILTSTYSCHLHEYAICFDQSSDHDSKNHSEIFKPQTNQKGERVKVSCRESYFLLNRRMAGKQFAEFIDQHLAHVSAHRFINF